MGWGPVHRYLAQARLADRLEAIPSPLTEGYEAVFARVKDKLRLGEGDLPDLLVAFTPEARVETLEIGGDHTVVYDQYLGQSFNRLNDFALAEWPQSYVIQWGFRHLGVALAGLGDTDAAGAALMCSELWPVEGRPGERSRQLLQARSMVTAIQERFVLAHECVHAATARRGEAFLGSDFTEATDEIVAFLDAREPDPEAQEEMMIQDEIRAVRASTGGREDGRDAFEAQLRALRAEQAAPQQRRAVETLAGNTDLREELYCDQIAAILVVAEFKEYGMDAATILSSILHGFHNLTSLSVIRDIAWRRCGRSAGTDLDWVSVRKGVWRTVMREFEAREESEEVHRRFVEITELHARTVGDQYVFILPFEFERLMKRAGNETFDRSAVLEAVRAIGSQPTELPDLSDLR